MGKRGINTCTLAGSVGGVEIGTSRHGTPYVRFAMAVEDRRGEVTWLRVSGYRGIHDVCKDRLVTGMFVIIRGALVNVGSPNHIRVEVVAEELIFAGVGEVEKPMPPEIAEHDEGEPGDDAGNRL